MIEILSSGAVNTVQDRGRFGYLDAGVGRSGAMDGEALEIANLMVGNAPDAAGIEIALFPFRLRFDADTIFAVAGASCPVMLNDREMPSWWAMSAKTGDRLTLGLPQAGARAVLAVRGGIDIPPVLGSRATDLKSGFGGLQGRGLTRGDRLPMGPAAPLTLSMPGGYGVDPSRLRPAAGSATDVVTLRVLPGAEQASFTDESLRRFYETDWLVTHEANRMGYRLSGPDLALKARLELFSHGIMPGTVQVPPGGQPIVQLAEANTCGGYPKIAAIIEADLPRVAQAPSGARLRFVETDVETAVDALHRQRAFMTQLSASIGLMRGW